MTHRFPIKEIALQAGLSTATVDRVMNGRAHVSPQTRRRVEDAIAEKRARYKILKGLEKAGNIMEAQHVFSCEAQ